MKHSEDRGKNRSAVADYVTVAIAEDMELAKEYADILAKNDIPVSVSTQKSYSEAVIGVAVMVPADHYEHAQEVIESQQMFDSFIDEAFNDSDGSDAEGDNNDYNIEDDFV